MGHEAPWRKSGSVMPGGPVGDWLTHSNPDKVFASKKIRPLNELRKYGWTSVNICSLRVVGRSGNANCNRSSLNAGSPRIWQLAPRGSEGPIVFEGLSRVTPWSLAPGTASCPSRSPTNGGTQVSNSLRASPTESVVGVGHKAYLNKRLLSARAWGSRLTRLIRDGARCPTSRDFNVHPLPSPRSPFRDHPQ